MAMRKGTRRELRKLRELVHFFLAGQRCCFCRELLTGEEFVVGDADGPQLVEEVTLHHRNGDHDDNRKGNLRLAHRTCHKRHHAKQRWQEA